MGDNREMGKGSEGIWGHRGIGGACVGNLSKLADPAYNQATLASAATEGQAPQYPRPNLVKQMSKSKVKIKQGSTNPVMKEGEREGMKQIKQFDDIRICLITCYFAKYCFRAPLLINSKSLSNL